MEYLVWCPQDRSVDLAEFKQFVRHKEEKNGEVVRSAKSRFVRKDHEVHCDAEYWATFPSFNGLFVVYFRSIFPVLRVSLSVFIGVFLDGLDHIGAFAFAFAISAVSCRYSGEV